MKRIFPASLLILFLLFSNVAAQTDEDSTVKISDEAMRQVVSRILTWYFKPRSKPKTIYLSAKGIKKEWLPEIKNIEFVLVPDDKLEQIREMFFFTELELSKGIYEIGFGFGEPHCHRSGDIWLFRVSKQKIRLWRGNGQVIHSCNY